MEANRERVSGASELTALVAEKIPIAEDFSLCVVRLNLPDKLNALGRRMAIELDGLLCEWGRDPQVAAVVIGTTSERAFCAGGDIRQMYSLLADDRHTEADEYFAVEYSLDCLLHKYPKPLICWGTGIVMGGGMGVMQGCSLRIATETTRIAMPETLIGFFPDVGACRFLRNAPSGTGLFLGLAGPHLDAKDAVAAGLADCILPSDAFDRMLESLGTARFSGKKKDDEALITDLLRNLAVSPESSGDSKFLAAVDDIAACLREDDFPGTVARLARSENPWVAETMAKASSFSPGAMAIWWRYWFRGAGLEIEDVMREDHRLSAAFVRDGEFREGVRALIIDKDRNPRWRFPGVGEVDDAWLRDMESISSSSELKFADF